MLTSNSLRWLVVAVSAAILLVIVGACAGETVEVPGKTVVVEKEVIKEVMVPGETVVVKEEVIKEVMVPGETVTKEVVKEVMVPGETVVVEKEVVKTVEVPGQTVVVEKEVIKEVAGKKYVTDPITGIVYSAPEYGGSLTFVSSADFDRRYDAYIGGPGASAFQSLNLEKLAHVNWAIDRDSYPFGGKPPPVWAMKGALAESWETPDDTTIIVKIRPGVYWHDKAPVNGRELTANDVEHTFQRMLGNKLTGSEFSDAEPSPGAGSLGKVPWESVEATDNSTVVFKLTEPMFWALRWTLDWYSAVIQPPELLEEYGDDWDWNEVVGTGPYMMVDLVPEVSATWNKNPNYWGYDEKYPENPLPYIDEVKGVRMTEHSTILAALRTANVDFSGFPLGVAFTNVDIVQGLERTNPELVAKPAYIVSADSFLVNKDKPPLDDVRVRHALQMALDLETMNDTHYEGLAEWFPPRARVAPEFEGYYTPYEEWSAELKGYYTYDPAGAEALLDAAGYPRGDDGFRFKLTYVTYLSNPTWGEFSAAYWREVGIDIEILTPDVAEYAETNKAREFHLRKYTAGNRADPKWEMSYLYSGKYPTPPLGDAQFDALYESMLVAPTLEERQAIVTEMEDRLIEQHFIIWGPLAPAYNIRQPWVTGWEVERTFGAGHALGVFSRGWIDSELKKSSGH